jgi:hypothetical protein
MTTKPVTRSSNGNGNGSKAGIATLSALLASLFIHLLLANQVKVAPSAPPARTAPAEPECVMISAQAQDWEAEVLAWADIHDPTFMTLPNRVYGFGAGQDEEDWKWHQLPPAYEAPAMSVARPVFAAIDLAPAPFPLNAVLADNWPPPAVPVPEVSVAKLPDGPIWRTPDGQVLSHMPRLEPAELQEALLAGQPEQAVQVTVTTQFGIARVQLTRSSGNRKLDALALAQVGQRVSMYEGTAGGMSKAESAIFFPPPDEPSVIEIDWRFLQTAKTAENGQP